MNYNIAVLRNIAIIAIVLHHAMCAFGGWPPNHSVGLAVEPIGVASAYLKNLGLGLFTFIAGFVFAYRRTNPLPISDFLWNKTKRILFPCIVCALLYKICFETYYVHSAIFASVTHTHLWYLPMLFMCMLVCSLHFYAKDAFSWVLLIYLFVFFSPALCHVYTFMEFRCYFPVFYLGYWLNRENVSALVTRSTSVIYKVAWGGVIFVWIVEKWKLGLWTIPMMTISLTLYVLLSTLRPNVRLNNLGMSLTRNSFAIYLFHQYVIDVLVGNFDLSRLGYYGALLILFVFAFALPWTLGMLMDLVKRRLQPD